MSEALPSRFRQQLYPPDSSKVCTVTQLPVIEVPAARLDNPVTHARPWFSQAAPVQSRGQPAQKPAIAQPPISSHPYVHLSHKTALSSFTNAAEPVSHVPVALLPASEVISHAPLPGSALLPSSPWRQNSPHLQAQAAPSTSGTSVIIATDISQPTLAQALGFADSPQPSASIGRQAPAAPPRPNGTPPSQCHHTTVDMRAMEILSQSTVAPSQGEQSGATGTSMHRAPHGIPAALSQSDLQRLVTQVEAAFAGQPAKFDAFLHLLHEHQAHRIDQRHFEQQVSVDTVPA